MESVAPKKRRHRLLSLDLILDTAIRLARNDGLAGVSMPSVSRSLGTTPMSLYKHVENKEALVLQMLDRATSMVDVPSRQDAPVEEVMVVFEAVHDMLRRDPWTIEHFLKGYSGGETVRELVSRSLTALNGLGLERGEAWQAHQALLRYTYGEALAAEASAKGGLRYDSVVDVPTEADETIREFENAASADKADSRYRETLQRYLRSVLDEVDSD